MTDKITEDAIEKFALQLLEHQGYSYVYGPTIAPDSETPERSSFEEVVLVARLRAAVLRINHHLSAEVVESGLKQVLRLGSPDLLSNNESFHRLLTEGVKVTYQEKGHERGDLVWLVDFANPENNEFLAVNQFTVVENHANKRSDVVLFVNGLPLVVVELKNAADEHATVKSAWKQIETYKQVIPGLFTYNGFTIISDGLEARAGTISSGLTRYMAWKTSDGKVEASPLVGQLETLIRGMLDPATLLDLIKSFIVYEKTKKEDRDTGIITIETVKKLASFHQYYAVNRAVESTMRAAGFVDGKRGLLTAQESPESYGLPGVSGKIVLAMDNPTVVVITDRNDLDDQLFDTFAAVRKLSQVREKDNKAVRRIRQAQDVVALKGVHLRTFDCIHFPYVQEMSFPAPRLP